jgi:hypothetical protein
MQDYLKKLCVPQFSFISFPRIRSKSPRIGGFRGDSRIYARGLISRLLSHSVERKPLEIMGQYYKFVNTTKRSESTIPLPFNFNLPYAKALENYSREELREKFDFVIQNNNWDKDDEVIAIGDYGAIFYYPED